MKDFDRGRRDAGMFEEVRCEGGAWFGVLQSNGSQAWITEPVTERYLDGLIAGGCIVAEPLARSLAA